MPRKSPNSPKSGSQPASGERPLDAVPDSRPESPIVRRAIAFKTYEVNSIEEAVELATRFKIEGKYNWFRGQQQDWPLYPTAARNGTGPDEEKRVTDVQLLLLSWLRNTPGLSEIADDIDAVLSIAQHHGLPTSLLDFTTDPGIAGYFASSETKEGNEKGCIYCLNTDELRQFDRDMREYCTPYCKAAEIAFIQPDVPNLWRMEAQCGTFLFAPSNIFDYYLIDTIEFPHPSRLSFPTARDVYPERKSPLEVELDHFFEILAVSQSHEMFREVFPDAKIYHIEPPPNRVEPQFFKRGTLPKMPCWSKADIALWQRIPTERLRDTAEREIGLRIDLRAEASELRSSVAFGIARALSLDPFLRMKSVSWVLLPQRRLQAKLRQQIDLIWNGMRSLPFADETIADAVALCFALHRCGFRDAREEKATEIAAELIGEVIKVGMGDDNGSSSYGYAGTNELRSAIRIDIQSRLRSQFQECASNPFALLQFCSAPERLFMFDQFADLFGRQIVPTQVARAESRGVFFSPARIVGFGLP